MSSPSWQKTIEQVDKSINLGEIRYGDQLATTAGTCCQDNNRGWCIWKRRNWDAITIQTVRSDLEDNCFVWKR